MIKFFFTRKRFSLWSSVQLQAKSHKSGGTDNDLRYLIYSQLPFEKGFNLPERKERVLELEFS